MNLLRYLFYKIMFHFASHAVWCGAIYTCFKNVERLYALLLICLPTLLWLQLVCMCAIFLLVFLFLLLNPNSKV